MTILIIKENTLFLTTAPKRHPT